MLNAPYAATNAARLAEPAAWESIRPVVREEIPPHPYPMPEKLELASACSYMNFLAVESGIPVAIVRRALTGEYQNRFIAVARWAQDLDLFITHPKVLRWLASPIPESESQVSRFYHIAAGLISARDLVALHFFGCGVVLPTDY